MPGFRVNTVLFVGVTGLTEKLSIAPAGRPEVDNVTGELKPNKEVNSIV